MVILTFTDIRPSMKPNHFQQNLAFLTQLTTSPSRFSSISSHFVPNHVHPETTPSLKSILSGSQLPMLVAIGVLLPSITALFGV